MKECQWLLYCVCNVKVIFNNKWTIEGAMNSFEFSIFKKCDVWCVIHEIASFMIQQSLTIMKIIHKNKLSLNNVAQNYMNFLVYKSSMKAILIELLRNFWNRWKTRQCSRSDSVRESIDEECKIAIKPRSTNNDSYVEVRFAWLFSVTLHLRYRHAK